ncbi:hypothetical protein BJX65DRAFT_138589 [Aspergillus insuetus]
MFDALSIVSTITSCHLEVTTVTPCRAQDSDHTKLRLNGGTHWTQRRQTLVSMTILTYSGMLVVMESISDPNHFVDTVCEGVSDGRFLNSGWTISLGGTHVVEASYMVAVVAVLGVDHYARFRVDEWITSVRDYS